MYSYEDRIRAVFRSDHPRAKSKSLNVRELMSAGLPLLLATAR